MQQGKRPQYNLGDSFAFCRSGEILAYAGNVGCGDDKSSKNCSIVVIKNSRAGYLEEKSRHVAFCCRFSLIRQLGVRLCDPTWILLVWQVYLVMQQTVLHTLQRDNALARNMKPCCSEDERKLAKDPLSCYGD